MFGIRKAFATHHAVLCSVLMSLKLVYHGKRRKGTVNKIHVLFVPEGMDDAGGHAAPACLEVCKLPVTKLTHFIFYIRCGILK